MATLKAARESQRKLDEYAAFVRESVNPASGWIKCSDEMPQEGQHVLCSGFCGGRQDTTRFVAPSTFHDGVFHEYTDEDSDESVDCKGSFHPPTHWQPLPAPPTE